MVLVLVPLWWAVDRTKILLTNFLQLGKFAERCDIIMSSLNRHKTRYFSKGIQSNIRYSNYIMRNPKTAGTISQVELIMNNGRGCEKYPHENMDEHCKLIFFYQKKNQTHFFLTVTSVLIWFFFQCHSFKNSNSYGHLVLVCSLITIYF